MAVHEWFIYKFLFCFFIFYRAIIFSGRLSSHVISARECIPGTGDITKIAVDIKYITSEFCSLSWLGRKMGFFGLD
ncbi:hypothetical protein [Xenorhabdus taiwanensis]|uniref:hypothetical protein n=1 Tax=Xenorhabdus taiwanensis TaxID=3085177 RepID=UPI0035A63DF9